MPIVAGGDEQILIDAVDSIREIAGEDLPAGLTAKVTGPAGFSADASAAFEGINSTLLFTTAILVLVLLVLIYRSPIFWIIPLFAVLLAEFVVRGIGYLLASAGLVINGQVGGILLVLVFGAGTDYALLLTARYREELRLVEDRHEAMRIAVRQAGPGDHRLRRHGRRGAALPLLRERQLDRGARARSGRWAWRLRRSRCSPSFRRSS